MTKQTKNLKRKPIDGRALAEARGYTKGELNRRSDYCEERWTEANNAIVREAYAEAADALEKCIAQMNLCLHDCRVLSYNMGDQPRAINET